MDERLVEAPSLRVQLHERLREAILSGELKPGERLSTTELARRFQVSTMPVRDALQLLEQEGLVETSARRWTRVAEIDPALVEELVPIVSLLEQQAIMTAPEPTPEDLAALRQANARFAALLEQGDAAGAIAADAGFHHWLVSLAGNRSLERTLRDAELRLRLLRPRVLRPVLGSESVQDHERIVDRLEAGDRAGAAQALAENWERGLGRYRATGTAAESR